MANVYVYPYMPLHAFVRGLGMCNYQTDCQFSLNLNLATLKLHGHFNVFLLNVRHRHQVLNSECTCYW